MQHHRIWRSQFSVAIWRYNLASVRLPIYLKWTPHARCVCPANAAAARLRSRPRDGSHVRRQAIGALNSDRKSCATQRGCSTDSCHVSFCEIHLSFLAAGETRTLQPCSESSERTPVSPAGSAQVNPASPATRPPRYVMALDKKNRWRSRWKSLFFVGAVLIAAVLLTQRAGEWRARETFAMHFADGRTAPLPVAYWCESPQQMAPPPATLICRWPWSLLLSNHAWSLWCLPSRPLAMLFCDLSWAQSIVRECAQLEDEVFLRRPCEADVSRLPRHLRGM